MGMRLIKYGATEFDPKKWRPVKNAIPCGHILMKPTGGLWTSPVDSEFGWVDWCTAEEFRLEDLKEFCELEFTGNAYVIDSLADLMAAPVRKDHFSPVGKVIDSYWLDFEAMVADGVDAIHLTAEGRRHGKYRGSMRDRVKELFGDRAVAFIENTL